MIFWRKIVIFHTKYTKHFRMPNEPFFYLYHGENKLHFNDMMMISALY
jgi:hypothetical protein